MEQVSPKFGFWNLVTFVPLLMNFFTSHPKTLRNFQKYHQKENIFYLALAILFGYLHYSITIIPLLRMQCTFCNNSNNNRHFPLSASYLVGRIVDFNVECKVNTKSRLFFIILNGCKLVKGCQVKFHLDLTKVTLPTYYKFCPPLFVELTFFYSITHGHVRAEILMIHIELIYGKKIHVFTGFQLIVYTEI